MIEPAVRLALALPLVLLALGGVLVAARRGLIRLPGAVVGSAPLKILQFAALGPGARLAVIEFEGERLLLSISKGGATLLLPLPALAGRARDAALAAARAGAPSTNENDAPPRAVRSRTSLAFPRSRARVSKVGELGGTPT